MKKQREYDDEMNEATKAKEVTAYEDSWYRSLKALADMRPTETEVRPAEVDEAPAGDDVYPAGDDVYPAGEDVYPADEGSEPTAEHAHDTAGDVRPLQSDEETAGAPED